MKKRRAKVKRKFEGEFEGEFDDGSENEKVRRFNTNPEIDDRNKGLDKA